jgi:hypothetical protein
MWQTKYASAVPINLGLGFDFPPCSEGNFLSRRSKSVGRTISKTTFKIGIGPHLQGKKLKICTEWKHFAVRFRRMQNTSNL